METVRKSITTRTFWRDIFCAIDWPPKEYNEKLATLTEKKLEAELQEFLVNVTGDESYAERNLEFCEEYIKE